MQDVCLFCFLCVFDAMRMVVSIGLADMPSLVALCLDFLFCSVFYAIRIDFVD